MSKKCRVALALLLAIIAVPMGGYYAGEKATEKKASVWMKTKLEFSRRILEGLTEADFDKIADNAKSLNYAGFFDALFRPPNPEYKHQITLFVSANEEIIRQAKAKNIYGATLAYNQLMVSCVQCHQMVRDARK
ncbi:MAG: hypothetical protein U0793_20210 [Gemmataceae bacterium]